MTKTKTTYGFLLALCFAAISVTACKGKKEEEKKDAEPKMEQPAQPLNDTANKADERPTKEGD